MSEELIQLKKLSSRLDILIALQMVEDKPNKIRDKIKLLHDLGAETLEIASILRISPNYAAKERSLIKKNDH